MASPVSSFAPAPASKPRRKRRFLKLVLLLVGIFAALAVPPIYRGLIWAVIQEEGFRQGSFVKIGDMSGSLWEPLVLKRVRWGSEGFFRGRLGVEVDRVECVFRWENLLRRSTFWRVWERMELKGLRVKWEEQEKSPGRRGEFLSFGPPLRIWIPDRMIFEVKSAGLAAMGWNCQVEESALELSTLAPGQFRVGRVAVQVGGWARTFRDLKGPTSLKGERLNVGGVRLQGDLEVTDAIVDLSELEQAKLSLELHSKAFGGELRAQGVAGLNSPSGPLEISGTFSKIGVAPLAAFLGVTEAAGGVLEEGKFSFRGSPRFPRRGTASLRLEAKNFQWESRQWDSLVVGATLLDRRVQVPEFSLRQGHNELQLSGDVQLPGGEGSWWRSDFGMNVTARIGDLTELSALLLPEFKYTAGTLSVDGAVRSQNGLLGGALIVTGSRLMWRKAPIEELNAAIKLDGNDIRVLSAEMINRADRIKAKGVLHVGESWWYDAELRASVGELGNYADLLQPPLVKEAVLGQAFLEWAGKGSAWGHEGQASGRFSGMRPLKPRPSWPNALQGDFEGTYGPEGLKLKSVGLGDGTVSVRSKVAATWEGARVEELRFQKGDHVALEGSLQVPGAVWGTWPSLAWDRFLAEEVPLEMDLRLDRMELSDLGRLPGVSKAWRGELSGKWKTRGAFSKWSGEGALSVREAAFPVGSVGVVSGLGMDLRWEGRRLGVEHLAWVSESGRYEGDGRLEWKEGQKEPTWALKASCSKAHWRGLFGNVLGTQAEVWGRSKLELNGPRSGWRLTGQVLLDGARLGTVPDVRWWWAEPSGARRLGWPRTPGFLGHAQLDWKIGTSGEGLGLGEGLPASSLEVTVGGTGAVPEVKGEVRLSMGGWVQGNPVMLGPGVIQFPGGGAEPVVELRATGLRGQTPFRASAVGPLSRVVREYQAEAPLSAEAVRAVFEEGKAW